MSEQLLNTPVTEEQVDQNARAYWKDKAGLLGIDYPMNITTDKLKELVQQTMLANDKKQADNGAIGKVVVDTLSEATRKGIDAANALVRFKITVMNPQMVNSTGILITAGNANFSAISRVIPFNAPVWHAERIIVEHLKNMKYQAYKSTYNNQLKGNFDNGGKAKLVPSFIIEELPLLTEDELQALAELQTAQGTGQTHDSQMEARGY